jgi:hypothetical protein
MDAAADSRVVREFVKRKKEVPFCEDQFMNSFVVLGVRVQYQLVYFHGGCGVWGFQTLRGQVSIPDDSWIVAPKWSVRGKGV